MIERTSKPGLNRLMKAGLSMDYRRKVHREMRNSFCAGIVMGLRAVLNKDDVCVDLGANVGEITVPLAETGATVHAFEPDPDIFQTLQGACGSFDNVVLHQAAVGVEDGEATFFRSSLSEKNPEKGATGGTLIASNTVADAENAVTAKVVNGVAFVADLLEQHGRVAFLKMDIEGAELDLMDGLIAAGLLDHIGLTVVETHRWLMPGQTRRYKDLEKLAADRPDLNLFAYWV
ncbi:MAG: FkbM family methyltransferase [Paracoccaceae bacterium]